MAQKEKTPFELSEELLPLTFLSRDALIEAGLRSRDISHGVAAGELIRLRKGRYVRTGLHADLLKAGRLGGRLDCLSLLRALGVFVHTHDKTHIQVEDGSTRLPTAGKEVVRHWRSSSCERQNLCADVVEALAQSFRCQGLREAIATLDSAWHHGIVDDEKIDAVFALLPRRYQRLRALLDERAESGPETLMRLMLRGIRCRFDVQVKIRGVGRVDFVVDGWLIIECDSKKYHEGWEKQKEDRARDMAAAALGYTTIRPLAEDILYRSDHVLTLLKAVIAHPPLRPCVQNSARPARRRRAGARSTSGPLRSAEF
ncbi:DUF559 domain-containing protein [Microbacterium sp. KR10-403]|uniref:DUF559 domain-containing protein n=1 Tax=Microbacterium sp. KR10-403 TaxID=3158581 RepID=UPI0032E4E82D